jgi:hypothetical protein
MDAEIVFWQVKSRQSAYDFRMDGRTGESRGVRAVGSNQNIGINVHNAMSMPFNYPQQGNVF